jgi:hypothetical protein
MKRYIPFVLTLSAGIALGYFAVPRVLGALAGVKSTTLAPKV